MVSRSVATLTRPTPLRPRLDRLVVNTLVPLPPRRAHTSSTRTPPALATTASTLPVILSWLASVSTMRLRDEISVSDYRSFARVISDCIYCFLGIYTAYILSNIFIILVAAKFLTYAKR